MTGYTAETTNATNAVTATPTNSAATIEITVNGTEIANGTAATWQDGDNAVAITVMNGEEIEVYTVTVTKS